MTRTIYRLDAQQVWTGEARTITAMDGRPQGWVESAYAPPAGIAQWTGDAWLLLDAYPTPAPAVPQSVTRRQAKQALLLAGLLGSVQPAIDAIPDATQRALVQIEWDDSQVFERDRPALISLAGALGLDDAALDQLFVTAAGL